MIKAVFFETVFQMVKPEFIKVLDSVERAIERGELNSYAMMGVLKLKDVINAGATSSSGAQTRKNN